MIESIFKLENNVRPIVTLPNGIVVMIDSGAVVPVWVNSVHLLTHKLNNVKFKYKDTGFGGFGGKATGTLYTANFNFGNFIYPNMPIIHHTMPNMPCHMIVSATMFHDMIYEINDIDKTFKLTALDDQPCRHIHYKLENGKIQVLYNMGLNSCRPAEDTCNEAAAFRREYNI